MRLKVRFNPEAGQTPIVLDVRFMPRIGERIHLGYHRVIEVLDVHRIENDNRYTGIVRARYIEAERKAAPAALLPRPLPMPPLPSFSVAPVAMAMAPAPVAPTPVPQQEPAPAPANYASLSIDELLASFHGSATPDPLGNG